MDDPQVLRKKILTERDSQDVEFLQTRSGLVESLLFGIEEFKNADTIFVYVNFRSEVNTSAIIEKLLDSNKKVTVPITHVAQKRIDAIQITDPEKDLVPGYCNIPEPREEMWIKKKVDPQDIDVILLPGSVFDERGGRFGYGGGFYDRFLSSNPEAVRIGLAFELQITGKLPLQDHDELLDYVVTEERIIKGIRE